MGGTAHSDFRQLHSCLPLSYNNFAKHTFGKNRGRRRFLLLSVAVHLVSYVLQLVSSVIQPLYLATRTYQEIFNLWICMRITTTLAYLMCV